MKKCTCIYSFIYSMGIIRKTDTTSHPIRKADYIFFDKWRKFPETGGNK